MSFNMSDSMLSVKRGAAWMDLNHPGWARKIDLSKLDMNNCHTCVIGQAVGNYFDELYKIDDVAELDADDWAVEHGFNAYDGENNEEFRALETLWTDEVRKRF